MCLCQETPGDGLSPIRELDSEEAGMANNRKSQYSMSVMREQKKDNSHIMTVGIGLNWFITFPKHYPWLF